jgi:membrane-associated HD superfamily phosphohydrolase
MTENELLDKTNDIISELVVNKHKLQKAFNYYNGKRDKE